MAFRRVVLVGMLAALGGCALLGMLAVVMNTGDNVFAMLFCSIAVAVGFGVMLPLTFLAGKPMFRAGAIGGILVLGMLIVETVGVTGAGMARASSLSGALAMMIGMTMLAGVPVTAGLMLASVKAARVAAWNFAGWGVMAMLPAGVAALAVATSESYRLSETLFMSGMATLGMGFVVSLLVVNVGCGDRRYFRWPAVAVALFGWVVALVAIGMQLEGKAIGLALVLLIVPAAFLGHLNVLLMARLRPVQEWLLWLTALASAGCGGSVIAAVGMEEEKVLGVSVAAGIAAMCGTMALLVLTFFNRKINELPAVETLLKEVALSCPRCGRGQTMGTGGAACGGCGLELYIRIVEPRCGKCGYLIYGVGVAQCPECGERVEGVLGVGMKGEVGVVEAPPGDAAVVAQGHETTA